MIGIRRLLRFVAIGLLLTTGVGLHAQDIHIVFSLQNIQSDTLSPYLKITYVNTSGRDYYLPAIAYFASDRPLFSTYFHRRISNNEVIAIAKSELYEKRLFEKERYVLPIDFLRVNNRDLWYLLYENKDNHSSDPEINDNLAIIDNSFGSEKDLFYTKQLIRNPLLLRKCPSLVFIKSESSVSQLISLSLFKDTGIILTVKLISEYAPTEVKSGWWADDLLTLPKKICKYQLYLGRVDSNPITLDF